MDMVGRSYFNSSLAPAVLRIDGIKKSEEGIYRCRVEYRRARTETTDMVLKVIVAPREAIIMDEFGQHLHGVIGPFNEGQPLSLACEGEGGDPSPSVKWWRQAELLDDSFGVTPQGFARNDLVLPSLQREDLMMTLTCQVSNSNLTDPVISSVILDMNLRPTDARITSLYRPFSVDRETEVVCVARGGRPPAQISWWMGADQIKERVTESSSREDNLTVSTLTIMPKPEDDHRNLSCRADNPQLSDSLLEDLWVLNVHYLPMLVASFQPQEPIREHSDVTLTCSIQANPPVTELEWLLDGRTVEKTSISDDDDHRLMSNRTLSIPSVGPEHKGHYQCAAKNTEGQSLSESVLLRILYSPKCQSVRSSVYGVGKTESVSVACEVDAEPQEVTFFWMLNNSAVSSPLPPSQYNNNGTRRSVATVSPRTPRDYGVLYCWASNSVGKQREPCSFRIIPAGPPEEPRNCATTNRTLKCLTLECEGGEDGGLKQLFQLEVFSTDSDKFLANVTMHKTPTFTVCTLPPTEALVFVIYAINSKGKSKEVTIRAGPIVLEGKSYSDDMDESATLTAILGIIIGAATVLILLGIFTIIAIKLQSRRAAKGRTYRPEPDKCDSHLMKECKEPAVTGSQGPDIIPEKRLFRVERTEVGCDVTEKEENSSTILSNTDAENRKYFEYQTVGFTEDHEFLATPKKLRLLQDMDAEVEESGITVETPLISSIPLAAQQWTDHRKEGLRLSTPV